MPDPTLAEKEEVDVFRDDVDDGTLEETDDENDVVRGGPASVVALTAGLTILELGGAAGFVLIVSPALSTNVFRFGAGSGNDDR